MLCSRYDGQGDCGRYVMEDVLILLLAWLGGLVMAGMVVAIVLAV